MTYAPPETQPGGRVTAPPIMGDNDMNHTERPCAAHGLTSYRYAGRYGHIMIGATSTQDALNEAGRSLTQGAVTIDRLEIWNALTGLYEKVKE